MKKTGNILDSFDSIRVVNLPERKDRRAYMKRELASVHLLDASKVDFFPAIRMKDPLCFMRSGSRGAYLSHLELLREAQFKSESILILQDDCKFFPAASRHPATSADVFYGGYTAMDPSNIEESPIIGAHFMGFSRRAVPLAVEFLTALIQPGAAPLNSAEFSFDRQGQFVRPPIDGGLVWFRKAHPELSTEFALLSRQRSSRTDIGDQTAADRYRSTRRLAEFARSARESVLTLSSALPRLRTH